jgi:hypothetical protein
MAEFKSVSLSEDDYEEINSLRKELIHDWSQQRGATIKVSMAETIKMAVTFYKQRRKVVEAKDERT